MPLDEAHPLIEAGTAGRKMLLKRRLSATRALSARIASHLTDEDQVVQAMDDASPTKWHLAHTTWFFEELILKPFASGYKIYDLRFGYCFNSYYETLGPRHPRPKRGLLTRPTAEEVRAYRAHVDAALARVMDQFDEGDREGLDLIELGINHEQQHQELMLTDALALFAANPLRPAFLPAEAEPVGKPTPLGWTEFAGGIVTVGHEGEGFCYDNETPAHQQLLRPFRLANRPVTNAEWLDFMADGGYDTFNLWLSDGWATVRREGWRAPLYWEQDEDGRWRQMTPRGLLPVDPARPVCHVSFYEADAFARWEGKRLPTEFEWEHASRNVPVDGNMLGSFLLRPAPCGEGAGLMGMFGDVWEWTASAYLPYPGFRPVAGAVGEYNGKFMCNQFVLRGGSCATPDGHVRRTYRNFFYPHHRWQFTGLRLADDA
jgi:ergothioneine biosynthesis protein EgtB